MTCASGPARSHYVSDTDDSRAQAYGPTRASSDVPETGDGGDQSGGLADRGAGRPQPPWRIKFQNKCTSCKEADRTLLLTFFKHTTGDN